VAAHTIETLKIIKSKETLEQMKNDPEEDDLRNWHKF